MWITFVADDERFLLAVKNPSVTNYTDTTVTIGWKTGPNAIAIDYTVKCVADGGACSATAVGTSATGTLPYKLSYGSATVTGLTANTTYSCYIQATWQGFDKCKGPYAVTTLV